MADTTDTLLRAGDVAKRLNAAKATVYEWARRDPARLGAVKVGPRSVRFRARTIAELVDGGGLHPGA